MNTTFIESNNVASEKTAENNNGQKSTLADNITELMTIISIWAVTASVIGLVSLTWVN
jgi:hypothetical protein